MRISGVTARASALVMGALLAVAPLVANAKEPAEAIAAADRGLGLPSDGVLIGLGMVGALLGLFVVVTLGYLYRRERHLDWEFQKPDAPHH